MPQSQVVVVVGFVGAADDRLLVGEAIDSGSGSTLLVCIIMLVVFHENLDGNMMRINGMRKRLECLHVQIEVRIGTDIRGVLHYCCCCYLFRLLLLLLK